MSERFERFLDRFTKPFAQNHELDLLVKQELRESVPVDGQDSSELEEKTARLEAYDQSFCASHWWWLVVVFSFLAWVGISVWQREKIVSQDESIRLIQGLGEDSVEGADEYKAKLGRNLDRKQQLLLQGDLSKENESDQVKALWELEPESPAYFADYVVAYANKHKELPSDFLEIAARIDPENGWFQCFAAAVMSQGSVKSQKRTEEEKEKDVLIRAEIVNEEKLRSAIDLALRGAALPRFDSYEEELLRQRVALLPQRSDYIDHLQILPYVASARTSALYWKSLAEALATQVVIAADHGDVDEVRRLTACWKKLGANLVAECHGSLVDPLVCLGFLNRSVSHFRDANAKVGLAEGLDSLSEVEAAVKEEVRRRKDYDRSAVIELTKQRGGTIAGAMIRSVTRTPHSPPVNEALLKPGRMVDYILAAKEVLVSKTPVSWFLWIALIFSFRFRHGEMVRIMSMRVTASFGARDWLWLVFGGIVAPVLLFCMIWFSPLLSGRKFNILHENVGKGSIATLALLLALLLVAPVVVARWRVSKRAAFFAWDFPKPWLGIGMMSLVVLTMMMAGLWVGRAKMLLTLGCIIIVEGWLLVIACRSLFGKRSRALPRHVVARMLVPTYAVATLALAGVFLMLHEEEKYWMRQEKVVVIDPGKPSCGSYEYETAVALRADLQRIIAPLRK